MSSDETCLPYEDKEEVTSPHDTASYTSFILKEESIETVNQLLLNVEEYKEDVSSSAPWHVIKSCCLIVDLMALKCPDYLFVDGWNWSLSKSMSYPGHPNLDHSKKETSTYTSG